MGEVIRIGIDIRDLKKARTGTYTYLKEITDAFRRVNSNEIEFIFISPLLPVYSGKLFIFKASEHLLFFLWKQVTLPLIGYLRRCSILFCTDYFVPVLFFKDKKITVFHDCLFFEHPEYYNSLWLKMFHSVGLAGARSSLAIITPSNYVKKRLQHHLPGLEKKIKVVYEGHADFKHLNEDGLIGEEWEKVKIFLCGKPYFLYVGTLDRRKNLDRLIGAIHELPEQVRENLKLIIAGSSPPYHKSDQTEMLKSMVKERSLENQIHFTGRVSQMMLSRLYQHALFLIQPSIDEGFGLTITEAMHFGLPFIAANNTAMPEIGGEAGLYFNPLETSAIGEAIIKIFNDDALRKKLIAEGQLMKERYNWDLAADELIKIFTSGDISK